MAGVKVTITDREFVRKIRALREGVRGPSALMKNWGEIAGTSILENFEVSGRPTKWKPLSKITIKLKGHARPLIGRTGNLMRITIKPEQSRVVIGTNPATKDYAARQQFGWPRIKRQAHLSLDDQNRYVLRDFKVMQNDGIDFFRRQGLGNRLAPLGRGRAGEARFVNDDRR